MEKLTPIEEIALDLLTQKGWDYDTEQGSDVEQDSSMYEGIVDAHIDGKALLYTNEAGVTLAVSEVVGYAVEDVEQSEAITLDYLYCFSDSYRPDVFYGDGGCGSAAELVDVITKHLES